MALLEWWADLSPWVRYPVALAVIAVSVVGLCFGLVWNGLSSLGLALGAILLIVGPRTAK